MTLDDAELSLYGDSGGSLAAAADATPDEITPESLSLWENIKVAELKMEASVLRAGASVIGWVGGKLTSLGETSENAKTTITTTASNAVSWLENKLIWLVVIVAVVGGLVYFGKKKIDKLAR